MGCLAVCAVRPRLLRGQLPVQSCAVTLTDFVEPSRRRHDSWPDFRVRDRRCPHRAGRRGTRPPQRHAESTPEQAPPRPSSISCLSRPRRTTGGSKPLTGCAAGTRSAVDARTASDRLTGPRPHMSGHRFVPLPAPGARHGTPRPQVRRCLVHPRHQQAARSSESSTNRDPAMVRRRFSPTRQGWPIRSGRRATSDRPAIRRIAGAAAASRGPNSGRGCRGGVGVTP